MKPQTQPTTHSSIHPIDGIQAANKNIYSYFMKSDQSYYVPAEHRYTAYKKDSDQTYIVVITKYETTTDDWAYKHNSKSIEIECLIGKDRKNLQKHRTELSSLIKSIHLTEMSLPSEKKTAPEETFIGLVYPDHLNRTSIMVMVDSVIKHGRFKGILILPVSLSVSFGLGLSNSVVVNRIEETVVCIEDNCVLQETYIKGKKSSSTLYGEDPVEEFTKKEETYPEVMKNMCHICETPFELSEFSRHFKNKHQIDVYSDQKSADAILQRCRALLPEKEELQEGSRAAEPLHNSSEEESAGEKEQMDQRSKDAELQTQQSVEEKPFEAAAREVVGRIQPQERAKKICSSLIYVTEEVVDREDNRTEDERAGEDRTNEENGEEKRVGEERGYNRAIVQTYVTDPEIKTNVTYLSKKEAEKVAWKGMFALTNIEPSKDLWLTDKEWESVGLRVLKEKILFPI